MDIIADRTDLSYDLLTALIGHHLIDKCHLVSTGCDLSYSLVTRGYDSTVRAHSDKDSIEQFACLPVVIGNKDLCSLS